MNRTKALAAGWAFAILAVVGCRKTADTSSAFNVPKNSQAASGGHAAQVKLNEYVEAYNMLVGSFGLEESYQAYVDTHVGQSTVSSLGPIHMGSNTMNLALDDLQKARALPGSLPELDASADVLIAALQKIDTRADALKVYYDSGSYRKDNLQRGKQEDGPLLAEFHAGMAASEQFRLALDQERDRRFTAELAAYKSKGLMLRYQTKLAMHEGEHLMNAVHGSARDASAISRADAAADTLEKTLAEQREELAKAKAAHPEPMNAPDYGYTQAGDNLTALVGHYRKWKAEPTREAWAEMLNDYNNAVLGANSIRN